MFCQSCGNEISEGAERCGKCGSEAVAQPADSPSEAPREATPDLKKMSVIVLIFLSVITYGIYVPVWFLKRRDAFNKLQSDKKLYRSPLITIIVLDAASLLMLILVTVLEPAGHYPSNNYIDLVAGFLVILQSFRVRYIFIRHFNAHLKRGISFNGAATFFFGIFYLQYKINRMDLSV